MDDEYYMDGVDGVGGFEEDEEEYIGDDKINRQKELVAIVKVNPPLWDKRQKAYSGKNFNKELAWDSVAEVLGNMSGSEAEKEFYKIRQKYGKERRKVITSLKGKSGQSAQPTYVPTWELYEMCDSFLRAVIIPRKTSSNYTKTASSKSNEISHLPTQRQLVVPQIVKPSVAHRITAAQTPSAKWTSEYASSLFGTYCIMC
ncbi:uncharacterized protein [Temnothorax nylanderi]|uniref:uncharacterized protein n=1 Tax=Temnothorax nylanderi TaxID=102681 RepID=UPI003A8C82EE